MPDYELVRRLGKGGYGEVWQARGPGGLDFALKFIPLEAQGSHLEVRALEVMKSIRHPNLVGLSGIWQRDNVLILAMELCDRSLQERLNETLDKKQTGVPANELLKYMRDAACGLDALHAKGVQHRDVKPLNLLLMQGGVKVADFGLAKVLDRTAASHTGALTVAYAAPEFFKGTTSQQSDQYSLAATYVHLRTGHTLYGGGYHQIVYGHLEGVPQLTELGEAERAVVVRALAKEPSHRWPNCAAFIEALSLAYHGTPPPPKPNSKEPAGAAWTNTLPLCPATMPFGPTVSPPLAVPKKRRRLWAVSSVLLLALLPLVSLGYFYGGQVIRVVTNQGQIVVEVDDPHIEVVVKEKGVVLQEGPGRREISVAAGAHELEVTIKDAGGETRLLTKTLTLSRGGKEVINVRQELAALAKKPEPKKPDPKSLEATLTVDLGDGVKMEFVLIDPKSQPDGGRFKMGSPAEEKGHCSAEQLHDVELTKPYYLAKYPVTQAQYQRLMGKKPSYFKDDSGRLPVESVSWGDAQNFCQEMTKKNGEQIPAALRQSKYRFALPTEAQWEYACRAGTKTPFYFGSQLNGKDANCDGNYPYGTDKKGASKERTTKVGEYGENPWRLCDMHGNVEQWCEDYYGPYNEDLKSTDPLRSAKHSEERRILRGGSWGDRATNCRAAYRNGVAPAYRLTNVGFRVCIRLD